MRCRRPGWRLSGRLSGKDFVREGGIRVVRRVEVLRSLRARWHAPEARAAVSQVSQALVRGAVPSECPFPDVGPVRRSGPRADDRQQAHRRAAARLATVQRGHDCGPATQPAAGRRGSGPGRYQAARRRRPLARPRLASYLQRVASAVAALPEGDLKLCASIWLDYAIKNRGPGQTLGFIATADVTELGGPDLHSRAY